MQGYEQASAEIRRILEGVARKRLTIFYSELSPQITSVRLEPGSDLLAELLDEASRESDAASGVMLSAVVIRKGDEPVPGPGFFKLARELGRPLQPRPSEDEKLAFHAGELQAVHDAYAD